MVVGKEKIETAVEHQDGSLHTRRKVHGVRFQERLHGLLANQLLERRQPRVRRRAVERRRRGVFDADGETRPAAVAVWDVASGRIVRRVMPAGEPARAIGFGSDGRLLYALAKGPELSVRALGDSTSTSSSDAAKRE